MTLKIRLQCSAPLAVRAAGTQSSVKSRSDLASAERQNVRTPKQGEFRDWSRSGSLPDTALPVAEQGVNPPLPRKALVYH